MATLVDTLLVSLKLDMNSFASDANKATRALDDLDKKAGGASTAMVTMSDDMIGASNAIDDLTKMQEKLTTAVYDLTQKLDDVSTAIVNQSDGMNEASDSAQNLDKSNQKLTESTESAGKSTKSTSNIILGFTDNISGITEKTQDWDKAINGAVKALAGLFTTIFVSTGLAKFIGEVSGANDQLHFLSKNLGMDAEDIKKWQNVAEMSGGSADGMTATMSNLNKSLWDLVTVGDASILPFFNALGVGVVDSQGKLRHLDDILLDMADSMSQMERPQAYNIAKNMGMDDGTINTLLEGREAIQKKLDAQKDLVISTKEELELNRKLREQNAVLSQQWEGLKTLVANYLIPRLLKLSQMVTGFLDYLNKNRETALNVFRALSVFLTLTLIPVLFRVGRMVLLAFAPLLGTTGIILALAAALWVLYDDYETWKKGGDSLFDWSAWEFSIENIKAGIERLIEDIKALGRELLGLLGIDLDNWSLSFELDSLKKSFSELSETISHLFAALNHLNDGNFSLAWEELKLAWSGDEKKKQVSRPSGVAAAERHSDAFISAMPDWYISANNWLNGLLGIAPKTGHHITPTTLDIPTGDPDLDRRKRKVQRGEMTLDELNGVAPNANKLKGQAALNAMRGYFMELEKKEGLPAGWLYGVAMAESSGYRHKESEAGAKGPFQFMPPTAKAYGLKGNDVFDWYKSSDAAAKMYGDLSRQFKGDLDKMLAGYNWGTGNMSKFGMKNMPKETRDYIQRVKNYREKELQDRKAQGIAQSLSDFQARMNQPLIPNMDMNAPHEFLAQTERIRSMPMASTNNNVKVDLNGDINVVTSANTVTGTVTDAGEAARLSLSQIMTSMG